MNKPVDALAEPFQLPYADAISQINSRVLLYQLLQMSEYPAVWQSAYAFLHQRLNTLASAPFEVKVDCADVGDLDTNIEHIPLVLKHLAAPMLTEAAWLQRLPQVSNNQEPLSLHLMSVAIDLGQGLQPSAFFQGLAALRGLSLPALSTWAFSQQAEINTSSYDLAAIHLALACLPRFFMPELLGFTLAYCQAEYSLTALVSRLEYLPELSAFCRQRQGRLAKQVPRLEAMISSYLDKLPQEDQSGRQRIGHGHALFVQQNLACFQALQESCASVITLEQAVLKLFTRIMPAAIGHHSGVTLGGKNLDAWFAASPFDADGFLTALKHSAYVDLQQPEHSPLLRLFAFKGPMFGVLQADELALLGRWLASLAKQMPADKGIQVNDFRSQPESASMPPSFAQPLTAKVSAVDGRQLFYQLVNIDYYPEALAQAKHKLRSVLGLSQLLQRLPFKHYSHQKLQDWVAGLYQHEIQSYQAAKAPSLSRQSYCWGIEQLAPAILTDGSWLQNVQARLGHTSPAIAALLAKIYADELGAGKVEQNHPYLYQQLMASIGLHLPPIQTKAFSQHAGFISWAFDIPNYLMAISQFPQSYLAELLGLNLAIELSGLGRQYLGLSKALRFYGLDSSIVDVHIAIDNVATGHSALAQQAIYLYMDQVLADSGQQCLLQHWQRVHAGYLSLAVVSRPFALSLMAQGFQRAWTQRMHSYFSVRAAA